MNIFSKGAHTGKYFPKVLCIIKNSNRKNSVEKRLWHMQGQNTLAECGSAFASFLSSDDFRAIATGKYAIAAEMNVREGGKYIKAVGWQIINYYLPKKAVAEGDLIRMFLYVEIPEHMSLKISQGHLRRNFHLPIA